MPNAFRQMIPGQKQLIVSFHDLHPDSWETCQRFVKKSFQLGARNMTLLVIPQYHRQPPFTENTVFAEWLKELPKENFDICLHGFYHQAEAVQGSWYQRLMGNVYTTGEGEFFQLTKEEAHEKLSRGMTLFNKLRLPVYGFTAPAWLVSKGASAAIEEFGFQYNTLWKGVDLPTLNTFIKAPTLVYSSRNAWRRFVSKIWVSFFNQLNQKTHIVRLSVHPIDFEYPDIEAHIYNVMEKALRTRSTCTYRDLVPTAIRQPVTEKAV